VIGDESEGGDCDEVDMRRIIIIIIIITRKLCYSKDDRAMRAI